MIYGGIHLCGDYHGRNDHCEYILYADKVAEHKGKELLPYYVYCTAEGKCRSMGCAASFTGNSPRWCPKRQALEQRAEQDASVRVEQDASVREVAVQLSDPVIPHFDIETSLEKQLEQSLSNHTDRLLMKLIDKGVIK